MTAKKILAISIIGILTYFGYDYFRNNAGTTNNTTSSYPTMGSTTTPYYSTSNYYFSDLFGSGQGTTSTEYANPFSTTNTNNTNDANSIGMNSSSKSSTKKSSTGKFIFAKSITGKLVSGTEIKDIKGRVIGVDTGSQSVAISSPNNFGLK